MDGQCRTLSQVPPTFTLDISHPLGLAAQVAFAYVGAQYTDQDNTVEAANESLVGRIDAYTTLDVAARYRYAKSGVSFGLAAKSLLDRIYISDRMPNGISLLASSKYLQPEDTNA